MSPRTRPGRRFDGAEAQETGDRARQPAVWPTCGSFGPVTASTIDFPPHDGELVFGFVLEGSAMLEFAKVTSSAPAMRSSSRRAKRGACTA